MTRSSRLDILGPAVFVLGLLVIAFGYGFLVAKKQLFPYEPLALAEEVAYGTYKAYFRPPPFERPAAAGAKGGAVVHDAAAMAPGVTFMVGYRADGFGAWLVDAEGRELHAWRGRFSEIFGQAAHLQWQARDETIAWHGAHLFADGSVLFNFQDNSFPYGSGLVKLDRDSKVLWKLEANTHHDVSVAEDGTIWVPSQRYLPEGKPGFPNLRPWYYEDTILKVSPEGQILDEISLLDAMRDWPGLTTITYAEDPALTITSRDPTHLNNVEPLPAAFAAAFPQFAPGDLMASLRNMNAVVVIDPTTRKVKWSLIGTFAQQHDPDFLPNGNILLFDNLGGLAADPACGRSRILEIEPMSQAVAWRYDGCAGPTFDSERRGMQELLENGNVLIAESVGGRVLEVTREAQPRLVWEYTNVIAGAEAGATVGVITHAERFRPADLPFLEGLPAS